MRYSIFLILGLTFVGCQHAPKVESPYGYHPFIGCWENESGLERETWSTDSHGLIFGYAKSWDTDGNVTFSERMFLNRSEKSEVLEVTTERDGGSFADQVNFTRRKTDNPDEFRFENPEHDFPQVIVYQRNGDALNAYIDLMAGGKRVSFDKTKCKGD